MLRGIGKLMTAGTCSNCGAFVWKDGVSDDIIVISGPPGAIGGRVFCNEHCLIEYEVDNDVSFDRS